MIIFDCAHNIDGISALTESLDFEGIRGLPIAFGCLDTKNWHEMMELLRPYVTEWNLLLPQSTRAVPNREVMEALSCSGVKAIDFGTDYEGFLKSRPEGEPLLVAGSMYMVGAVRSLVVGEERILWHRGRKGSYAAQDKNRRI